VFGPGIGRGRHGIVAKGFILLAALIVSMASGPLAQAQPRLTADMPMRPGALSQADYDAIVAEAKDIARLTQDARDLGHWPAQWRSGLDRTRLAALWSMPESATLAEPERNVLVEQAADWDMLAFERPSDAAALWKRLWPFGQGGNPNVAPNSIGLVLVPDANWSDNAVAMVSVFSCFPPVAWTAPGDPAVWAMSHGGVWQWGNWDGPRECIREIIDSNAWLAGRVSGSAVDSHASDRRYDAVGAILKAKFTHELLKDGCARQGPDSCLVVYQALYGLDRKNPQLAAILHRMERSFDLDQPIAMPTLKGDVETPLATAEPVKKKRRSELSDADRKLFDRTLADVQRRQIFLTLKLPVLLDHPEAWPSGEIDRTLRQAMDLNLLIVRMEWGQHRSLQSQRYYADPWQWVDASADPTIVASLRDIGASHARNIGCDTDGLDLGTRLRAFWQGYAIEVIRAGRGGSCRAFGALRLPDVYQAAAQEKGAAAAARDMAVFAPIDAMLGSDGEVRTQALDAMATTCAVRKPPSASDPWSLCAGVAARDAQKAADERKQEAAEAERLAAIKASEPPPDPYSCGDGKATVMQAVHALGYKGDADFWWGEKTACRIRPDHPDEAIVALTYTHGDQLTGVATSPADDPGFDLDVVVIRTDDGSLVARNKGGGHIDSDAVRFEGFGIDTANYLLAPGQRAFGVHVGHSSQCYHCIFGQSELTLYLQHGNRLDAILDTVVDDTRGDPDSSDCTDLPTRTTRTIKVAPGASHGLADLLLTTTTKPEPDDDAQAACKAKSGSDENRAETIKVSFDGTKYPLPAGFDVP
jgi:hypothetical protein